ncbi:MAG: transposase, partial [Desulfofustis sp.]
RKLKSITAQEIVSRVPEVQKQLWGGEFWTDGYVVSTVGEHANEDVIGAYIQKHGDTEEYNQLHKEEVTHQQLTLF